MSKKTLRIHYIHIPYYDKNSVVNRLSSEFEIIEDSKNPEYIIVGYDALTIEKNYRYTIDYLVKNKNAITIFYTGESILPDFNLFDYILGRDNILFGDRFIRYLYNVNFEDNSTKGKTYKEAKELLEQKKYFCNFIYSHGNGHALRDIIFDKLSVYKFVHALGGHKKNSDIEIVPREVNFFSGSIDAKVMFKFSIAAENCLYKDGTTEKIYTSFLANTIPIYFGDINVSQYFNKEAFINYHDYDDINKLVNRVKEVDNNDELWIEMMMQPFRTKEQIEYLKEAYVKSNEMFLNIFRQNFENAKRKPSGLMVDYYSSVLENNMRIAEKSDTLVNKIVWYIPVKKWRNAIRKKFL